MKQLKLEESLKLLKKYNIKYVNSKIVRNEDDFNKIRIDYPIVLKVFSEDIIHKSEKGGVIVDIKNKKEAIGAFTKLSKISERVLMQDMVEGKEIIIGMKKDPQFGPVIMFGLGGIFVEVMKDVSFRVCPVNKQEAIDMIKEIKSFKILSGVRGENSVNIDALANMIVKISNLSLKEKLNEIDLNPVIVDDKEAIVVDVRFMV